jgi:Holliday junction resolvase RusA-like endonuclease
MVVGHPVGKGRPRFGNGRTWTPAGTVEQEDRIRLAWEQAGEPKVDGPLELTVRLGVRRPRTHFTTKGALSATGRRFPQPHRTKPDIENAWKLVADSLNELAWPDDVQFVEGHMYRSWSDEAYTLIEVRELPALEEAA